jgi:hypothetical protein
MESPPGAIFTYYVSTEVLAYEYTSAYKYSVDS